MRPSLPRALLLCALLAPATARAGDDVEKARSDFAEGVKHYREGDYEGARVLFRQADAAHHAPAIVYNIARTEERLAHPQAAVDAYDAYLASEGEKGEFTEAAILAIARIRASARQLHIESEPSGARLFVDGAEAHDRAPTRVLVPAGRHHVVAEGDGWRAEADVDAIAANVDVTLARPAQAALSPGAASPSPSAPSPTSPSSLAPPASAARPAEAFVFGAQTALVPHRFDRTENRPFSSVGLAAGLMVEAGYSPSEMFAILGRGLFAVGSKGVPATTILSVGVALSFHVTHALWIGAALQGGRALLPGAIVPEAGEPLRFDTDWVFCPTLEVSLAVLTRPYGQWLVSFFPGYYFASPADSDVVFAPIGFGLRTF